MQARELEKYTALSLITLALPHPCNSLFYGFCGAGSIKSRAEIPPPCSMSDVLTKHEGWKVQFQSDIPC